MSIIEMFKLQLKRVPYNTISFFISSLAERKVHNAQLIILRKYLKVFWFILLTAWVNLGMLKWKLFIKYKGKKLKYLKKERDIFIRYVYIWRRGNMILIWGTLMICDD